LQCRPEIAFSWLALGRLVTPVAYGRFRPPLRGFTLPALVQRQIAQGFYYFLMVVVVIRYKTKATARRALTFIVRIFVNDTIAIAVGTSFHLCVYLGGWASQMARVCRS
jgi:hypothetical protein